MNKQEFIDTLTNFKSAFNDLRKALEETTHDVSYLYPFDESFDEINVNEWVDEIVRQIKNKRSEERQKLFLKIIQELEYRYWEYDIVNDCIQIEIGNEFWEVSKYDYEMLQELHDEIDGW